MRIYYSGKDIITFAVLGIVALLIVGALGWGGGTGKGGGSYLYMLEQANSTRCPLGPCNESNSSYASVITISALVLPIAFLVAIVLKLI